MSSAQAETTGFVQKDQASRGLTLWGELPAYLKAEGRCPSLSPHPAPGRPGSEPLTHTGDHQVGSLQGQVRRRRCLSTEETEGGGGVDEGWPRPTSART